MLRRISIRIITSLLILLFGFITITKMFDYNMFRHVLRMSPLIGENYTLVSVVLFIVLLWVSILLMMPATRLWGLYGSALILLIISLYLGYVIYFVSIGNYPFSGIVRPRFGILGMTWVQFFVFNIIFFLLSLTAAFLKRKTVVAKKEKNLSSVAFT